ncbi:hypothetical protein OIU84_007313 [Salix udensis]|uniref:Uncharacterized protein n=1 Tax=Salix udensis TaxID=889485 RepID=A0AAD6JST7_9ROSI|nr:hypothetical protein OIU84_007313 [Salix udensis]
MSCRFWLMGMRRRRRISFHLKILSPHAPLEIEDEDAVSLKRFQTPTTLSLTSLSLSPLLLLVLRSGQCRMAYLFDNILIARDEKVASSIRDTTWKPKFDIEKEKEKADEAPAGADVLGGFQKKVFELLYQVAELSFLSEHKDKITELIEKAEKQPIITIGVLVSIVVVILTVFLKLIFGGKKAKVEKKPEPVAETSNKEGSGDEKAEEKEEPAAPVRKRQTRREN